MEKDKFIELIIMVNFTLRPRCFVHLASMSSTYYLLKSYYQSFNIVIPLPSSKKYRNEKLSHLAEEDNGGDDLALTHLN